MTTTPRANVLRTLLQVILAVCVAIPTALTLVPIPSKYQGYVALVIGLAGAVVVVVTAVQNVLEHLAGVALFRPAEAAQPAPPAPVLGTPPMDEPTGPAQPRGPP